MEYLDIKLLGKLYRDLSRYDPKSELPVLIKLIDSYGGNVITVNYSTFIKDYIMCKIKDNSFEITLLDLWGPYKHKMNICRCLGYYIF
jgi:hypothetical protein